jgi:DNA-binding XRE family transcriptional regulator
MADNLTDKIQDLLNSSTRLSRATRQNFQDQLDLLIRQGAELSRFQALYDSIGDSVDAISNSLNYIYDSLKDSVGELQRQNIYLTAQKSALNKISDIAREVLKIRRGESELDTKKLAKLRLETTEKIRQLEFSKRKANITQDELDNINDQISTANELYDAFDKVLEVNKAFNKELGLAPQILSGLDKFLSKLGIPSLGIAEALSETKMLHQEAKATGQRINLWSTFSGKVRDNFSSIFTKANLIQASIGFLVDALTKADTATGDLAKDFNLTYDAAANVRNELIQIGNLSGNIALNARALQESMVAVGKSLGSNAMLNQADLETFTELREMAGYTNEELIGIQKLTLATGGNLKNNTKQFLGTVAALNAQNKLTINEKQLLKEVSNTSAAIKLSIGGTTKELAASAFQAKQFGINLDQADKIAESLLDFESSITAELSAELITGKDLNLEKARLLALNGDIAGASAEILKQVKGSAEFTAMNRIQQEALAKAVGMSREELAASLIEREALQKIGVKDAAAAKVKFDLLVKEKGYAAAVAELGDEEYANQLKQQSIQERMNKSVEKMKEIFISIAEPILQIISPFVDILLPVLSTISGVVGSIVSIFKGGAGQLTTWQKIIASTLVAFTTIKAITLATMLLQQRSLALRAQDLIISAQIKMSEIATAVAKMTGSGAASFGITAAIGLAAGAAAYGYLSSMKDGEISYNKGPVVSGEFGSVQLNSKDTGFFDGKKIVAGTNLGGGKSNSSPQQDLSPLLEEMRAMRQETARSNNKPIVVENSMDGTKFGNAVTKNTYRIQ